MIYVHKGLRNQSVITLTMKTTQSRYVQHMYTCDRHVAIDMPYIYVHKYMYYHIYVLLIKVYVSM